MQLKKILQIFFIFFLTLTFIYTIYYKFFKKPKTVEIIPQIIEEDSYKSNIIKDVNYTTKDAKGNEYIVTASEGEIDYSNTNILYLTEVKLFLRNDYINSMNWILVESVCHDLRFNKSDIFL